MLFVSKILKKIEKWSLQAIRKHKELPSRSDSLNTLIARIPGNIEVTRAINITSEDLSSGKFLEPTSESRMAYRASMAFFEGELANLEAKIESFLNVQIEMRVAPSPIALVAKNYKETDRLYVDIASYHESSNDAQVMANTTFALLVGSAIKMIVTPFTIREGDDGGVSIAFIGSETVMWADDPDHLHTDAMYSAIKSVVSALVGSGVFSYHYAKENGYFGYPEVFVRTEPLLTQIPAKEVKQIAEILVHLMGWGDVEVDTNEAEEVLVAHETRIQMPPEDVTKNIPVPTIEQPKTRPEISRHNTPAKPPEPIKPIPESIVSVSSLDSLPKIEPKMVEMLKNLGDPKASTKVTVMSVFDKVLGPNTKSIVKEDETSQIQGKKFVFAGSEFTESHWRLEAAIKHAGGKVSQNPNKSTNYLVSNAPDESSKKVVEAKKLGVKIITEIELLRMFKASERS